MTTDYSAEYSSQKKSNIYFGYRKNIISFKPFLESLSYEKTANVKENSLFYNITLTTKGVEKLIRKLAFNVVSTSTREAKENHKKFHKLLRMLTPTTTPGNNTKQGKTEVYVYFANLISDSLPSNTPPTSFDNIKDNGILFNTNGLEYSPDLDMGFFDDNGMLFAKSFKISMELTETSPKNRKTDWVDALPTGSASRVALTNTPGSLFGFPTTFKFENKD